MKKDKERKKKKVSSKKKVEPKKKVSLKKKVEPKKKVSSKKKVEPKKKVSSKKKVEPKKKVSTKKRVSKRTLTKKELRKFALEIDLRKLTKEQREYVKSIREQKKEGYYQKKFTKYLLNAVENYLSLYNQEGLIKNFYNKLGVSNKTLNKIFSNKKVSNETYKKITNFVNQNFNSTELSFFWQILNHLKNNKGKISNEKIRDIVNELYDFLNYVPDELDDLDLYDYLHTTY